MISIHRSRLAVKEAPALVRMAELSAQYPRYGYRRIRIFWAATVTRWVSARRTACGAKPSFGYWNSPYSVESTFS